MPAALTSAEIKAMLLDRLEDLVADLLPNGAVDRHEYRVGSIHGEPGSSLAIHIGNGHKRGWWVDFGDDACKGDVIDLIAATTTHGDIGGAFQWARQWLGVESGDHHQLDEARRHAQQRRRDAEVKAAETNEKMRRAARGMWHYAQAYADSPAEHYMRGRGIDFRPHGKLPGALRYRPDCLNTERGERMHAMVSQCIRWVPSTERFDHCATHRTWLELDAGAWLKAKLARPKKVLGAFEGAFIPVWRGGSGKSAREAPDNEPWVIGEGIEDSATAAIACPQLRCIAAISIANIRNLWIPPQVKTLILLRQHDTAPEAIAAFERAVDHHERQGRTVLLPTIPRAVAGRTIKDINDLRQAGAA